MKQLTDAQFTYRFGIIKFRCDKNHPAFNAWPWGYNRDNAISNHYRVTFDNSDLIEDLYEDLYDVQETRFR